MRHSSATAVPVTESPYPREVRSAIADLIRDHSPTVLGSVRADRRASDWVTVTASLPNGDTVVREVYLDAPWVW